MVTTDKIDRVYRFEPDKLKKFLAQRLPSYMVPKQVLCLNKLPVTENGKIHYQYLLDLFQDLFNRHDNFIEPENEIEQRLLGCWQQVLVKENISVCDSFFSIGGDSLLAMRLIHCINSHFDLSLSIQFLYESPSIRSMADSINSAIKVSSVIIDKIDVYTEEEILL